MRLSKKSCEDKKKILYLGHDPCRFFCEGELTHFPIIKTVPYPLEDSNIQSAIKQFSSFTHLIITSRQTVFCLQRALKYYNISKNLWDKKRIFYIGHATYEVGKGENVSIANPSTAEGVVQLLESSKLASNCFLFYPHSSLARPLIREYLEKKSLSFLSLPLYTTVANQDLQPPLLEFFDEIVFTSPSTVDAFILIYGQFPLVKLTSIGSITAEYLNQKLKMHS